MRKYLSIFSLLIVQILAAQGQPRVIPSVTEWIEEMNNWPGDLYEQRGGLHVKIDLKKDSAIVFFPGNLSYNDEPIPKSNTRVSINKKFFIEELKFIPPHGSNNYVIVFKNLDFKEEGTFFKLVNGRIIFSDCTFKDPWFARPEGRFKLEFNDCKFEGYTAISNPTYRLDIRLQNCVLDRFNISSADAEISLYLRDSQMNGLVFGTGAKLKEIRVRNCQFNYGIDIGRIEITNDLSITESLIGNLQIDGTVLPFQNAYLPFDSLENKLCLSLASNMRNHLVDGDDFNPYRAATSEEIQERQNFDRLIASYHKLLSVYKARGETQSYNACYIEMRDKQTAQTKLVYENNSTFANYFDYQINRFTKVFSDYGTRPAKAILIFFQVVLAFSVFYFFFPSTWNTTNSEKMMKRLSYLGSYFTSKEGLSDLFEKESKEKYMSYGEFDQFMSEKRKELPFYFQTLSKPLYKITTARYNWTKSLLIKTDILEGKWSELPTAKKMKTSVIIGIYLIVYLTYIFMIRCLNAITLSLNAFSTLGFGEIPTKGMARYVTIVQGFVGWFLLSIFLVSLIGQILN
jgi:hypothetical protein